MSSTGNSSGDGCSVLLSSGQVAGLLDAKGVGNITPLEIMESLGSFGLEGEEAEDILIQVGGVWGVFLSVLVSTVVVVLLLLEVVAAATS